MRARFPFARKCQYAICYFFGGVLLRESPSVHHLIVYDQSENINKAPKICILQCLIEIRCKAR